ncbi:MAG: hypothetical protein J5613_01455, partial [Alphaproteobacteria bacterium]|nr:hypothetical protein [Alphaproteobacteria bacterium]
MKYNTRKSLCFLIVTLCTYGSYAYGIDYSRQVDEGFGKTYFYGDGRVHVGEENCSLCDNLEPGKNDWFVRIGTDVIYGAAACSTVPSGTPNTAVGFGWVANYTPSAPIQNDKILHTYADKGFYCYCRVTQLNDTKFTDSPWLWLNGGFSKYESGSSSEVGNM